VSKCVNDPTKKCTTQAEALAGLDKYEPSEILTVQIEIWRSKISSLGSLQKKSSDRVRLEL
jgi:hypothetical protein